MSRLLIILVLLLPACGRYVEDRLSEEFEPIYLAPADNEQPPSDYGAIYKPNQSGLFAMESRAHRVGDILTVSFTEEKSEATTNNAIVAGASGGVKTKIEADINTYQVAYVVGGATLGFAITDTDNADYVSGKEEKVTIFSIAMAF